MLRPGPPGGAQPRARRWSPGWKMTAFVAVFLPVVTALGVWQLERAALKHGYEERYFHRMAEPVRPAPQRLEGSDFMRVGLTGRYDPTRYFLVDNQVHEGRPGYWVISVFGADDGREWLVNRGWIAAPATRELLPEVPTPASTVAISGVLWPDTGLVPLLARDDWAATWPKRVQRLDIDRMAGALEGVAPVEVRLEAAQPGLLEAAPLGHDFKARTHEGYAAQWFGLGAVLVAGYIIFGFKRHD